MKIDRLLGARLHFIEVYVDLDMYNKCIGNVEMWTGIWKHGFSVETLTEARFCIWFE